MRVIAGALGGRIFASPHGHATHPMSDKARGALFNTLGDIEGLTVLDAFAGSGAIAFEAISRGAKSVLAIDSDKSAQRTISENCRSLGVDGRVKLVKASAGAWLTTSVEGKTFDIVICDPPYQDLQLNLITRLAGLVSEKGLLVLSWPGQEPAPSFDDFEIASQKSYGDIQLLFYSRSS